jgi:hypothetical protein
LAWIIYFSPILAQNTLYTSLLTTKTNNTSSKKKKTLLKRLKKKLNQEKKIYLDPDMFFKSRWDSKQPSSNSHYRMESVEHNNDKFYR